MLILAEYLPVVRLTSGKRESRRASARHSQAVAFVERPACSFNVKDVGCAKETWRRDRNSCYSTGEPGDVSPRLCHKKRHADGTQLKRARIT
jgi:hypothetical protein